VFDTITYTCEPVIECSATNIVQFYVIFLLVCVMFIGIENWGGGSGVPAPKFPEKYFLGNCHVKFRQFSDKYHVKFWNLVNFLGICHKSSGILIIFRANITKKFWHFKIFRT